MLQPPVIWSTQSSNGYALQFGGPGGGPGGTPHGFMAALMRSGEHYIKPIITKPATTPFSTTDAESIAAGSSTVTPASMTNIVVGMVLAIDQGALLEYVRVTAVTGTTFTANFANAHNGTGTPYPISGVPFIAKPTASPAPSAGQPADGWWHMLVAGETRGLGVEGVAAGAPLFGGGDAIWGCLIWAITGGEIEINAH